jgi:hypothetical protein
MTARATRQRPARRHALATRQGRSGARVLAARRRAAVTGTAAAAGLALVAGGAQAGLWYAPFAVGLLAGLASRRAGWRPSALWPAVLAAAVLGWAVPLSLAALRGQPVAATARVIAALSGLPGLPVSAAGGVALTLAVSGMLAVTGLWLGRAVAPGP